MFLLLLITIVRITQPSTNPIEIKGSNGLSYRLFVNQDKLCFQYKLSRNWSELTKLDSGDISEYVITVTSGDYLHVTYCKNQRVCYRTTLEPITKESIKQNMKPPWSTWVVVSIYFTEPASNLILEISGEWVCVVWRDPNEDGNSDYGEIWQRKRRMDWPIEQWTTPENKSRATYKN